MSRYAETTTVTVERSRIEIEQILQRYGCEDFAYWSNRTSAQIAFKVNDRMLRFDLNLPDLSDFDQTPTGRHRKNKDLAFKAWEQACRQHWRALCLVIKAKLEAVESGITSFDIEFMAHMVVPGGKLFHEVAIPQIAAAYETGSMPPLLSGGS